jgi:DNA modification methylase
MSAKLIHQTWPIGKLIAYENNPRKNDHAVDQIAQAIDYYGFRIPVVVKSDGTVIDGHLRLKAAQKLGMTKIPVVLADDMTEAQVKAFRISVNRMAELADWDQDLLRAELQDLQGIEFDMDLLGFDVETLEDLLFIEPERDDSKEDDVPEPPADPVSKLGDVWLLGKHRVMCGDSTKIEDVEKLMDRTKAQLIHADPPYGMGKENEGIANDNLYKEKLDKFQMDWWKVYRPSLDGNASAYIWGCAPDLWRLWYQGGLNSSERLTFRNHIIWSKESGQGMLSDAHRMFPTASEHVLFFMLGEQGFNNNADNYWEGWEPFRDYLVKEKQKAELTSSDVHIILEVGNKGGGLASHYFGFSQWMLPTEEHYNKLKTHCIENNINAFKREYDDLKREYDDLKREFYKTRAYFCNTHDSMTDVWKFPRVQNEERHSHATPKPVAMMERIMMSSLPKNGLCVEPFLGSGSTLIAAEKTNRTCYGMEISPAYVDVIINRWQTYTNQQATLEATGQTFDNVGAALAATIADKAAPTREFENNG